MDARLRWAGVHNKRETVQNTTQLTILHHQEGLYGLLIGTKIIDLEQLWKVIPTN